NGFTILFRRTSMLSRILNIDLVNVDLQSRSSSRSIEATLRHTILLNLQLGNILRQDSLTMHSNISLTITNDPLRKLSIYGTEYAHNLLTKLSQHLLAFVKETLNGSFLNGTKLSTHNSSFTYSLYFLKILHKHGL